ncbi:MAG: hypothetical protein ACAH89_10530 [Rariglobus sp.]|nr:hypothetical protein [Rariglobus sp.]
MRFFASPSAAPRIHLRLSLRKNRHPLVFCGVFVLLLLLATPAAAQFSKLESDTTPSGYLATLLINEAPFPGERGYVSEEDTKSAMLAILWVLHGRLAAVPAPYTQWQVAGVKTTRITDIITGDGERRQCEGFFRDPSGRPVCAPRVVERRTYLVSIANKGNVAGRFSRLLNFAQGLSSAYVASGIAGADRFALLRNIGSVEVTGGAFSWMTDKDFYNPGGNFVRIPDADSGSLGGNRFFTLRKSPK